MKKLLATAAFIALASTSAFAGEKEEVNAAFTNWRKALSSSKAENVVKLYDKDAILLATLAAKPLTTQEQRTEYFSKLTAKPKLTATVDEEHIKLLDEDNAVVSGLYTFRFEEAGKTVEIPARYSFVYEKENGQWMIVEHHSSKVPQLQ
ncbi:MAG: SgcJ/EcaC family oxidoreductase [Alphaproteobacteria bacterium]|nr:SgcJ/EcaC family oxidoreductase [Alphaproteobacteria bacterium]